MSQIIIAVVIVAAIGLIAGLGLAVASVVFVAAVGGISYVVLKKRKTPEDGNEE